jgi:hypothetical protein
MAGTMRAAALIGAAIWPPAAMTTTAAETLPSLATLQREALTAWCTRRGALITFPRHSFSDCRSYPAVHCTEAAEMIETSFRGKEPELAKSGISAHLAVRGRGQAPQPRSGASKAPGAPACC